MSGRFEQITGPLQGSGLRLFPIKAASKSPPLVKNWPELATDDTDRLREWSDVFPDANAAVHCAGMFVLDIDRKRGRNGFATLETLEANHGQLPATFTVRTPTGGEHRYYRLPPDIEVGNSAGQLGEGLDVRSGGGFVVAPGSVLTCGKHYTISRNIDGDSVDDLPIVPDWLIALCAKPHSETVTHDQAEPAPTDPDAAESRAVAYLASLESVAEGGRNQAAYKSACWLRDFGLTQDHTATLMREHFRCEPPLDDAEIEHCAKSAFSYAQNPPGSLSAESLGFEVIEPTSDAPKPEPEVPMLWLASSTETPKIWRDDYLVKGWIWRGVDAQLFGPQNVGKTFIALHLAVHLAAGVEWFGQRVQQGGVLYLSYEGNSRIRYRLAALKLRHPELPWDQLPFAICPMNAPLVAERATNQNELPGRKQLQGAIHEFAKRFGKPPALLVIDTYSRAIAGSTSDEQLAGLFGAMAGALRDRYGATTLRIHHPGHFNQERARGSYAIGAAVDVELRVSEGLIEAPKQRDAEKNRLGFRLERVVLGKDQDGDEVSSMVVIPGPARAEMDLTALQQQVMHVIRTAANGARVASRRSVLDVVTQSALTDRRRLAEVLTALSRKQRIRFDRCRIWILEGGASAIFDDEPVGANGALQ